MTDNMIFLHDRFLYDHTTLPTNITWHTIAANYCYLHLEATFCALFNGDKKSGGCAVKSPPKHTLCAFLRTSMSAYNSTQHPDFQLPIERAPKVTPGG